MPNLRPSNKPISSLIDQLEANPTFNSLTDGQKRLLLGQATQMVNVLYRKFRPADALKGTTVAGASLILNGFHSGTFLANINGGSGTLHTWVIGGNPAPFPNANYFLNAWGEKDGFLKGLDIVKTAAGFTAIPGEDGVTVTYVAFRFTT